MIAKIPAYFNNPQLEDKLIQQLRQVFSVKLDWLDYCFGKVERMTDNEGREWGVYKLNDNSINEYRISPDNNISSMMFFEVVNSSHNIIAGELSKYTIDIYCWFNKTKITNIEEDVTQLYVNDIITLISRYFYFEGNITQEHKRDNVFDFSGFNKKEFKPIIGNYGGFKLTVEFFQDDKECYKNMSISIPLTDSGTFTESDLVDGVLTINHKLNSSSIVSATIIKANKEVLTLFPIEVISINQIKVDLGGIEAGTHIWTMTCKEMFV